MSSMPTISSSTQISTADQRFTFHSSSEHSDATTLMNFTPVTEILTIPPSASFTSTDKNIGSDMTTATSTSTFSSNNPVSSPHPANITVIADATTFTMVPTYIESSTIPSDMATSSVTTSLGTQRTAIGETTFESTVSTIFIPLVWPSTCPDSLPNPTQILNLAFLTYNDAPNTYQLFQFTFTSPPGTSTARISFEFQSDYQGLLLDDVSVKAGNGSGVELLYDGGFEEKNTTVWQYCYPADSSQIPYFSPTNCRPGNYCFQSSSFNLELEYLAQSFTVEDGERYAIEFHVLSQDQEDRLSVRLSSR